MTQQFASFQEFWPHYLREHSHAETRSLHVAGTIVGLACLAKALESARHPGGRPLPWLAAALASGYGPAWLSHMFLEGNRPATFQHPAWSLLADLRMSWLWATGRLDAEVRRRLPARR